MALAEITLLPGALVNMSILTLGILLAIILFVFYVGLFLLFFVMEFLFVKLYLWIIKIAIETNKTPASMEGLNDWVTNRLNEMSGTFKPLTRIVTKQIDRLNPF